MKARLQYLGLGVASAWPLAFSAPAWAANGTMTITGVSGPSLGKVAAASNINGGAGGDTTFTIDPSSGGISATGPAVHGGQIGSGTAVITVTVKCGNSTNCSNGGKGSITALASPLHGRARELKNFTVAKGSGNIVPTQTSATTTVTNFTLPSISSGSSKTFQVGLDFPIAGDDQTGLASGSATATFQVAVIAGTSGTPTGPMTGTASATVYRGISMSRTSDLVFGVIGKPSTGTGTVTMSSGGSLTTAGGAMKLTKSGVTPTAAVYSIFGEGSEGFSLSIPGSFSMMSGTNSLVVTTSASAAGSQHFPGSAGTLQTFPVQVGGSFSVASGVSTGAYTGTFTITAAYN